MTPYIYTGLFDTYQVNYRYRKGIKGNMSTSKIDAIITTVSEITGLSVEDIKSRSRKRPVIVARHVSMFLVRLNTRFTLGKISELFNRDHASVIHAVKQVNSAKDINLREITDVLEQINEKLPFLKV